MRAAGFGGTGIGNRVQQDSGGPSAGAPRPDIAVLSLFPPALLPAPAAPAAAGPAARLLGGFPPGFREGRAGDPAAPLAGAPGRAAGHQESAAAVREQEKGDAGKLHPAQVGSAPSAPGASTNREEFIEVVQKSSG